MNYGEVEKALNEGKILRYGIADFKELGVLYQVNTLVALPLLTVTGSYPRGSDIDVYDENNLTLGVLCLCRGQSIAVASLSDYRYAAYINDVDFAELEMPYVFKSDYLVVDASRLDDYRTRYMTSAPLWGGFLHASSAALLPPKHQIVPTNIKAIPDLKFPTMFHEIALARSTNEPYGFERYLKLYHVLELAFDWEHVCAIRSLGPDLRGIGILLNEYHSDDISRLTTIIKTKGDASEIAAVLSKVVNYMQEAKLIFFDFEKKHNPYRSYSEFTNHVANNFTPVGGHASSGALEEHRQKVFRIAAYFIYRIRCCVAHNKIGEYVMKLEDEKFVVEFGEPLLRTVVKQILK